MNAISCSVNADGVISVLEGGVDISTPHIIVNLFELFTLTGGGTQKSSSDSPCTLSHPFHTLV